MKRRRILLSMGVIGASGGLVAGSGALTSSEASRGLRVEIVGDEDAYLKIVYAPDVDPPAINGVRDVSLCSGLPTPLLSIGNQLTGPIDVQIAEQDGVLDVLQTPGALDVGDSGDLVVSCVGTGETTLEIQAVAPDGELVVDVEREFNVSCFQPGHPTCSPPGDGNSPGDGPGGQLPCPSAREVTFTGQGNVRIEKNGAQSLPVVVWYIRNGAMTPTPTTVAYTQGGDFLLRSQDLSGVQGSDKFAAVYIPDDDVTYYHQNLTCGWSLQGGGGSNQPTNVTYCGFKPPSDFFDCNAT